MNATAIIERDDMQMAVEPAPSTALTPMQMAYQLAARGTDVATIKEMLAIGREMEADQARRAFDAALAEAKAEIPVIRKSRHVGFEHKNDTGSTDYWHEDLGEIAKTIDPILGKHGLSYRFRSQQVDGRVVVTCVLAHRNGHYEETTLSAAPDASGKKNAIQQVGSSITYLQRYTIKMALGLAAAKDDDGAHAGGAPDMITEEQVADLQALIEDIGGSDVVGLKAEFLKWAGREHIADIPADKFKACVSALNSRRGK